MRHSLIGGLLMAVLALCVSAAAVCSDAVVPSEEVQPEVASPPGATEVARLLRHVPDEVEECTLVEAPTTYSTTQLPGYLGDAAQEILDYQHEWTVSARYRVGTNGLLLTVDVHRMSDALEAYGPYSRRQEQPAEAAIGLRASSFWLGAHLHVWRGPLYLQVYPQIDDLAWRTAVQQVAQAVVAGLPRRMGTADMLRLLPGRRATSVSPRYYRDQVPGLPLQGPALVATYTEKTATTCELVLLRRQSVDAATKSYDVIMASLSGDEEDGREALPEVADRAELFVSPARGSCGLMQQDHCVAVVLGYTDRGLAEALLRMTATNVRIYLLMHMDDPAEFVSSASWVSSSE